jgi:2-polyprenyl-3-methyl-5-hydroxy-6-metoxy-1,4-benzoquinol methylase
LTLWIILEGFKLKKNITKKTKCVLCGSKKLKKVLDFKKTPLANSYVKSTKVIEKHYPLICVLCIECKHLQLQYLVNPKILFEDYMYVSGTSSVLVKHFENYFNKIKKSIKLNKKKDKILDIACNDGTFLNFFKKDKFKNVIGIEPAKNLRKLNKEKKIDINTDFFNYKSSFIYKKKYKEFKVITANNVFAHVPNLKDFALGIKNILAQDGLFIFEVSYLKDVLKKLTFDTIYHEHMSYHSLKPLLKFFKSINLEVVNFDLVEAQGGSIRVYVGHKNSKINKSKINRQVKIEKKFGLFSTKKYLDYFKKIESQKNKIKILIKKNIDNNKLFAGYGAPAKVTTFCHVFGLGKKEIKFIVDDNDLKQGKYTPGKNIEIINFQKLQNLDFDFIIILAWNFADPIIKKLKKNIKNKKFKIIVPFPNLKVI